MKQMYTLTEADGKKGSRRAQLNRRAELRLLRNAQKFEREKLYIETFKVLLTNPAIDGTIALFLVDKFWGSPQAQALASTVSKVSPIGKAFNFGFDQFFRSVGLGILTDQLPGALGAGTPTNLPGALGAGTPTNLTKDAVEIALLAYIATGGNLAGVLTTGGSILSQLLGPAAAASVVK
ncbi:MAG: hypothetical protein OK436_03115 [Thaumarchaeota archaeon]|nr:hypothetical protein [Nitrososphaerota archaeon]